MNEKNLVFECNMCGQCCTGKGGIVLGPRDLARLLPRFNMTQDVFLAEYAYEQNGKYKLRTGFDNNCVFFQEGQGCLIHEDKPDICNAWPFFRGNMIDSESFAMAKSYCPGIRADVTHERFVAEGQRYLKEHALQATDGSCEANALLGI